MLYRYGQNRRKQSEPVIMLYSQLTTPVFLTSLHRVIA